jgi:hypothetical protein
MPHLALGRLRAVFDFRQQRGFDPDAAMRDLLGVGLGLADQRFQARLQLGGRCFIEAVVDLAGINQVVALQPAEIDAVELVCLQREAGDRQRLALRAGFLDPVIAAAGRIAAGRTAPSGTSVTEYRALCVPKTLSELMR